MINLKIDPEFQSQIPPLTDDEFKQLEENTLESTTLRWKLPSGASSRTLIFLCATFPMCPMMPM